MNTHTKGPWRIKTIPTIVWHPTRDAVAIANLTRYYTPANGYADENKEEVAANARLIAASPCLLEALEAMIIAACSVGVKHSVERTLLRKCVKQARTAIQKATAP